ncbi:unnamed protein product [Calypogeia fissa]
MKSELEIEIERIMNDENSPGETLAAIRADVIARKLAVGLRSMTSAERLGAFSQNEGYLKSFYRSNEPETTQKYNFIDVHRSCKVEKSGERRLGLFLNERAVPGQLLIVENAKASCYCMPPESTPYKAGQLLHAPKAEWMPRCPRIPPKVRQHLQELLEHCVTNCDHFDHMQIINLDAHRPDDSTVDDGDTVNTLWSIVDNNAICDKVRSLTQDEPRRVDTVELWGVWLLPSYINHSCTPNCHRMRVGGTIFIRAATEIEPGDELTLPYFDIFEPLSIRAMNCQTFGFRCDCDRCEFERLLGDDYDEFQMQIIELKARMQNLWSPNLGHGARKLAIPLLTQLTNMVHPIKEFIEDVLCLEDSPEGVWINASFIDVHIAAYALMTNFIYQELWDRHYDTKSFEPPDSDHEAGDYEHYMIMSVQEILNIVNEVHPGNVLGQAFYCTLVQTLRRFVELALTPKKADGYEEVLQWVEPTGLRFCSSYYGYPGAAILKLLLATES